MEYIIVLVICAGLSLVWRWLFWKYVTRAGAPKSWTLLHPNDRAGFLNYWSFMLVMLWVITYLMLTGTTGSVNYGSILTIAKVIFVAFSIVSPTVGANIAIKHRISQELR